MREFLCPAQVANRYLLPFAKPQLHYEEDRGYIVWRLGTGENVELLHIRSFFPRKGNGKKLVMEMLKRLDTSPPYHSVFGFTRSSNEEAQKFYGALGFNLSHPIAGLYREGEAVIFWQSYETLTKSLLRNES